MRKDTDTSDSIAEDTSLNAEELLAREKRTRHLRILMRAEENQPFLQKHDHYMERDKDRRLSPEREAFLLKKTDDWAREEILTRHMWLCVLGVIEHCRDPELYDDAFGVAVEALVTAFDKRDTSHKKRFRAYASAYIEGAVKGLNNTDLAATHVPQYMATLYRKHTRPSTENLPDPAENELAFLYELKTRINEELLKSDAQPVSYNRVRKAHHALQAPLAYTDEVATDENGDPLSVQEISDDANFLTPAERAEFTSDAEHLWRAVDVLDEREWQTIKEHVIEEKSLREVGTKLLKNDGSIGVTSAAAGVVKHTGLRKLMAEFNESTLQERRRIQELIAAMKTTDGITWEFAIRNLPKNPHAFTTAGEPDLYAEMTDFHREMNEAMKNPPKITVIDRLVDPDKPSRWDSLNYE